MKPMLEFKNLLDISFVKRKSSGHIQKNNEIEIKKKQKKGSSGNTGVGNKGSGGNTGGGNKGSGGNTGGGKKGGKKDPRPKEPILNSNCRYYYREQLNESEKQAYDLLLAGLLEEKGVIRVGKLSGKAISKVWFAIYYEHPEIFWYKGHYSYSQGSDYVEYIPKYLYDKKERDRRQAQIDNVVNDFFRGLNDRMTEYERLKAVYEFVILHVEYVTDSPDNQNIYSAIVNKKSVCAGYSRMAQYLLQKMGFECLYVRGPVTGHGYHAWNIVKCNGDYYQMDATWGDANYGKGKGSKEIPKELSIEYAFLCCTDEEIYKGRKSDMEFTLPVCNATNLNYYRQNGLHFMIYCENVRKTMEENIKAGKNYWKGQFSNEKAWKQTLDEVHKGLFSSCVKKHRRMGQVWISRNEDMRTIICWEE